LWATRPTMVVGRSFLNPEAWHTGPGLCHPGAGGATSPPGWSRRATAGRETRYSLPVDQIHPPSLKDGEVYFLLSTNPTNTRQTANAVTCRAYHVGGTRNLGRDSSGVAKAAGTVAVPLALGPQESRFIVIGALPGRRGPADGGGGQQPDGRRTGRRLAGGRWAKTNDRAAQILGDYGRRVVHRARAFTKKPLRRRTLPPDGHVYLDSGQRARGRPRAPERRGTGRCVPGRPTFGT